MENLNAYEPSKIFLIRYLLVFLVLTTGLGAQAEGKSIIELDGNWIQSAGQSYEDSSRNPHYTLKVTESGDFNLSLKNASSNCEDTDPYLYLLNEEGELVTENDDAYEKPCIRNSGIQNLNLDKGKYTLVAATFSHYDNGDFTISVTGSKDTFTLDKLSTKKSDFSCSDEWKHSAGIRSKNPYNNPKYSLTVSKEQEVIIDLKSDIDNVLILLSAKSRNIYDDGRYSEIEVAMNDDREYWDRNALINQRLKPGQYVIVASTFYDKKTGNFNLSIKLEDDQGAKLDCNPPTVKTDQENFYAGRDVTIVWSENENAHSQPAEGGNGSGAINYTSSNPDFRVDGNGNVTFDYPGSATITATKEADDNYYVASDSYLLTVEKADQKPLKVNDITIPYAADSLYAPDADQIEGGSGDGKLTFEIVGYRFAAPTATDSSIPLDVVEHVGDFSKLKIVGVGELFILVVKAETRTHKIAYTPFKLKVERAKQWIEFPNATHGKIIKNISDGEFSVQAISGIWSGQKKINQDQDGIKFTINNYPNTSSPVYIFDSSNRMRTTKIGKTTITATKAGNEFFEDAEANFELEVRPGKVAFTGNNLYEINNLNKVCGDSFIIDLSVDGKSLRDNKTFRESGLKNDNAVSPYQGLFTFHSDNETVAKVNENTGKVSVVGIGSASITASLFGDNSIEPVASYNLYVNEKGNQAIQFKGDKSVLLYESDIGKTIKKEIVDGWGENPIEFTLEEDILGLIDLNSTSGEVKIDFVAEKAPQIYRVIIAAEKPEDRCYLRAEDTYSITYYRNGLHSPKLGQKWDKEYEIKWSFPDYGSGKKIKLYYTNFLPDMFGEITKKTSIKEVDISESSYKWDTSALPEGDYYIIAEVEGEPNTISNNCSISGINDCFMLENPVEIEHDYGLVMDCSKWYNYPAELGVPPITCPSRYMALLNDNDSIINWGSKDNSLLRPGESFSKIYPTETSFLVLTKNGRINTGEYNHVSYDHTPHHLKDFTSVYSAVPYMTPNPERPSGQSFAGKRDNGSIYVWNDSSLGRETNVTKLITIDNRFVALKDDGSISIWSNFKRINWDVTNGNKSQFQKSLASIVSFYMDPFWGKTYTPVGNIKSVSENGGTKTSWDMPIGAEIFPARLSKETNFYTMYYPLKEEYPRSEDIIKLDFSCKIYHENDSSGTIISRGLGSEVDACGDLDALSEKLLSYLQPGQTYRMRFIINDNGIDGDSRPTFATLSGGFNKDIFVRINDNNDGILYRGGSSNARFEWRQIADSDYIDIVADNGSGTFIALNKKGEINQFTSDGQPYDRVPEGADYIKIFALKLTNGYLAMRADGSVVPWGMSLIRNSLHDFVTGLKNLNDDAYSWNEFGLSEKLDQFFIRYKGVFAFDGDPKVTVDHEKKTIKHEGNLLGQLIFIESGQTLSNDVFQKAFNPSTLDGSENFKAVPFKCKIRLYDPGSAFLELPEGQDISLYIDDNGLPLAGPHVNRGMAKTRHINGCDLRSIPAKAAKVLEPNKTYIALPVVRIGYEVEPFQAYDVRLDSRGLYRVNNGVSFNGISIGDLAYQKEQKEQEEGDYREATIYSSDFGFLTNNLDYWGSGFVGAEAKKLKDEGVTGKIFTSGVGTAVLSKVDGSIRFFAVQYCKESAYSGLPCQNHPSAEDDGYIKIYSNNTAFAALKADGTITTWGRPVFDHMKQQGPNLPHIQPKDRVLTKDINRGDSGGPTDNGYISIIASRASFTAIKANGDMYTWGILESNDAPFPTNIND